MGDCLILLKSCSNESHKKNPGPSCSKPDQANPVSSLIINKISAKRFLPASFDSDYSSPLA